MCRGVPAIDAATCQVDYDIAAVYLARPTTGSRAVPDNDAPRLNLATPAQDDDVMAVPMKGSGQNRPDLSGSAWNDDLHIASPLYSTKRLRNSGPGARHCSNLPNTRYRFRATTL